jgi:hypothetical protein
MSLTTKECGRKKFRPMNLKPVTTVVMDNDPLKTCILSAIFSRDQDYYGGICSLGQ